MASAGSPYFRASGVCDWCCGTKASNVSSLSARCAGIVLPARRQCVAPSFEMFGPRDGRSEPRPASLIRGEALSCAKQKNIATAKNAPANAGDVWTWTAIDADTKLIPSWFVGGRDSDAAIIFMDDLASRLANRVQLTSDGHRAYLEAVEGAFGADIDYAQLVKLYGESPEAEKRYSPAVCIGAHKNPIEGNPDPKYISTSYAERQNLNVRMHTRRFTRLTNAFSKKIENHAHSVALFAMYYNFVRIHKALRTTPAMAANVTKRLWEIGDIVDVLEAWENTT
jgi:IS1 family transposase